MLSAKCCFSNEFASWLGAPEPTAGSKKPTGCLLGACSGRTTGGTVSPYSPCCFQEYLPDLNTGRKKSFAPAQFFFCSTKLIALRDLVGDRRWPGSHQLGEAGILP